jgi:hypothetical protein
MKRPLIVTAIGILLIAVGLLGAGYHWKEGPMNRELAVVELSEAIAVIAGVFLLLGRTWARWLLLAWMAFHVVISAFDSTQKLVFHIVVFGMIAASLLRPPASEYFRSRNQ